MKLFLNRLFIAYALLLFVVSFLFLFPWFLLGMYHRPASKTVLKANHWWSKVYFFLVGLPIKTTWHFKPDKKQQYIFCANHFSYLDIPVIGYLRKPAVYIGKSSIARLPLFGFMFRKLHIMVNRESVRSRAEVFRRASHALDEGKSVFIFPEGGIRTDQPPFMTPFKDGAFRMAIEKQIPIVPVTIPYNWIILPDDNRFVISFKRPELVMHPPLFTHGLTVDQISELREKCYDIIHNELTGRFPELVKEKKANQL